MTWFMLEWCFPFRACIHVMIIYCFAALQSFVEGPPFTLQRVCEVIVCASYQNHVILYIFCHPFICRCSYISLLVRFLLCCYQSWPCFAMFCASSSWNFFVEVLKVLFCLYSSKIQCLYVDVIDCWDSRIISANQSVLSPCCEYYLIIWNKEKFYIVFKAIGDTCFLADIV